MSFPVPFKKKHFLCQLGRFYTVIIYQETRCLIMLASLSFSCGCEWSIKPFEYLLPEGRLGGSVGLSVRL